jgi:hypothetical protein
MKDFKDFLYWILILACGLVFSLIALDIALFFTHTPFLLGWAAGCIGVGAMWIINVQTSKNEQ